MSIYSTTLTSIRAVQCRGTNLKEIEAFLDWHHEYKGRLKHNWDNGDFKVKSLYGWLTIPRGENAWIVQGYKEDIVVMADETFRALFESVGVEP